MKIFKTKNNTYIYPNSKNNISLAKKLRNKYGSWEKVKEVCNTKTIDGDGGTTF